jgi:hypothetical protein
LVVEVGLASGGVYVRAPELPEVEYRRPAWIEPPADVAPGVVPVELVLARTPQRAIGLTGIRAYPRRVRLPSPPALARGDPRGEQSTFGAFNMFGDGVDPAGEFVDYYLRFGVGFADGKATNLEQRHGFDEGPAPDPPALRLIRWRATTCWPGRWLCGCGACPRRGHWPSCASGRLATSLNPGPWSTAGLVLEAAGRVVPIWRDELRR